MPYRLTKIYTRKGDEGYTTLGESRLSKDEALVQAVGTLDELNATIGMVLSHPIHDQSIIAQLTQIQHDLFDLGGELHLPKRVAITADHITRLENALDTWNKTLSPLTEFILPRGNVVTTQCHFARTVCRRAERDLVSLHRQTPLQNPELIRYLNRLSDLLFVVARILAREHQDQELLWDHQRK